MSFFPMLFARILLSALIVLATLPRRGVLFFLKGWFVFFAVNFFFAGGMLGIWMLFAPRGMLYYNGVVYFHLNPLTLLLSTMAAYLLLSLISRLSRGSRLSGSKCRAVLWLEGKSCTLEGFLDTGNGLYEPFSGIPVVVCQREAVRPLLGEELYLALKRGELSAVASQSKAIRLIPYAGVGKGGALPAVRLDELVTWREGEAYHTERVYMAITGEKLGDGWDAILHPDLIGTKITVGTGRKNGGVNG